MHQAHRSHAKFPSAQIAGLCLSSLSKRRTTDTAATKFRTERATTMTNRFVQNYRNWRKYRDTYNELMRLTQRDLDDLGINRVDIPAIARQSSKI
jgi:uncharacterized protein YjiS (DUF1127 family)